MGDQRSFDTLAAQMRYQEGVNADIALLFNAFRDEIIELTERIEAIEDRLQIPHHKDEVE